MSDTVSIVVPGDVAARLRARVDEGLAQDEGEALRDAVDMLEAEDARRLEAIRAKIAVALNDPRPSVPAEQVFERLAALVR